MDEMKAKQPNAHEVRDRLTNINQQLYEMRREFSKLKEEAHQLAELWGQYNSELDKLVAEIEDSSPGDTVRNLT